MPTATPVPHRPGRARRWFLRLLAGVATLLLLLAGGGWLWLRAQRPDLNATYQLAGLHQPVEVRYDTYGVPHIYARNEEDAYYALGFVHAQDRLFQMELLRRLADGRLAEVFGPAALPSDRFFRTMSFRQHARQTLDSTYGKNPQAPFVKAVRAYVRGINAFQEQGKTPLEFRLAGLPKTPFTVEDVELIQSYMAFNFAEAFTTDTYQTYLEETLGAAYVADFDPDYPPTGPRIPTQAQQLPGDPAALARLADQLALLNAQRPFAPFSASNGWVLAGSRTRSGKPMLANDTHVQYSQPTVYFEAHLDYPGYALYGSFVAGLPFAVLGHNQHGGWGITMFENDDMDFYRERPNPANPNQVWFRDHWEDLRLRRETIRVKGQPDELLTVRASRHGWLIQDVEENMLALRPGAAAPAPVALWWTFYQFPNRSMEASYDMAHARTPADIQRGAPKLISPGMNIMWADTAGNIGWWAVAKLVKRPAHVRPNRLLDGASGRDEPLGWADFARNPQVLNPANGFIYTANNQPADMGTGLVPGYYVPTDRPARILEFLDTPKRDWTPAQLRRMINDVQNPQPAADARHLLSLLDTAQLPANGRRVARLLAAWNGSHQLTDVAPTFYYRWFYYVTQVAMTDELGTRATDVAATLFFRRNASAWLRNDASVWWDDRRTPWRETRRDIVQRAFTVALRQAETQWGTDPAGWQWQRVHRLTHRHPLGGVSPVLAWLLNVGPAPIAGGRETLNLQAFRLDSSGVYDVTAGPNLRRIVDFADPDHATSVSPTGQSGNAASPHYADQARLFNAGGQRTELMNRQEIERATTGILRLRP